MSAVSSDHQVEIFLTPLQVLHGLKRPLTAQIQALLLLSLYFCKERVEKQGRSVNWMRTTPATALWKEKHWCAPLAAAFLVFLNQMRNNKKGEGLHNIYVKTFLLQLFSS